MSRNLRHRCPEGKSGTAGARLAEDLLVLLVDAERLRAPLQEAGCTVEEVASLDLLTRPIADLAPRAIVIGPRAARGVDWPEVTPTVRAAWPLVDLILWAPDADAAMVRDALQSGVHDVLLDRSPRAVPDRVQQTIEAQQLLPRTTEDSRSSGISSFEGMLSRSQLMHDLFETTAQVAASPASVLILGETGTGKELLARAIHRRSGREGRFVAINCAAVPETLIDSELFGHVEGAFTGATKAKEGLFRYADGGTLLLDEAGNVPLPVQYRLLRVLQEGAVRPVGGHHEVAVDVRVIAATSALLEDEVQRGAFREDLLYRLDVIRLVVPPLRERPDDIIFLFAHFARRFADEYRVSRPDVTDGFLDALVTYPWPGNVRQLENFTERVVLTEHDTRLTAERLQEILSFETRTPIPDAGADPDALDLDQPMEEALRPHLRRLEKAYLEGMLSRTEGRVAAAAERAGISRRTLSRMMARLGIDKTRFKGDRR